MKLYYSPGACSLAVHIIIQEIGVPCDLERVDLHTKQTEKNTDFLKVNPKGAVPTLELADGSILTENAVIQQYLADKYQASQLLPAVNNFKRYQVLEWLNFVSTDLHKTAAPLFNPKLSKDSREFFTGLLSQRFSYVNQALGDKKFLMGDQFTLPDAYLFVLLSWMPALGLDVNTWPNLARYFKALGSRPAIQKALRDEGIQPKAAACELPS